MILQKLENFTELEKLWNDSKTILISIEQKRSCIESSSIHSLNCEHRQLIQCRITEHSRQKKISVVALTLWHCDSTYSNHMFI